MTKTSSLSGEEVAALMDQLSAKEKTSPRAEPFALGTECARPLAAIPALHRMSERAARRLRERIEPISRIKPRVTAEPVTVTRFENWKKDQAEFTSISLFRFRPLKGGILISVQPELVGRLVDAFYGGSGGYSERVVKEFTPTEERLLTRLSEALVETLTEVWSEVMPVKAQLSSRETNISYAALVPPAEAVAVVRFTVALGTGRPCMIDIVYPVASLRAIEAELSAKVHDDNGVGGAEWKERMGAALGDVRLEARSVLARPTITLAELLKLAPGDVIPISVPPLVPLLVSGRQIALGKIGEQDGRAALQIEKVENRKQAQ